MDGDGDGNDKGLSARRCSPLGLKTADSVLSVNALPSRNLHKQPPRVGSQVNPRYQDGPVARDLCGLCGDGPDVVKMLEGRLAEYDIDGAGAYRGNVEILAPTPIQ